MKNGLAYHFVIGNGQGADDGEIEVGQRWRRQLPGGHCRSPKLNREALGICLVGNFEESAGPTPKQFEALTALVLYVMQLCEIPASRVAGHKDVQPDSTLCPGKHFPHEKLRSALEGIS